MNVNLEEFNNYMKEKIENNINNEDKIASKQINDELLKLNNEKNQASNLLSKAIREFNVDDAAKQNDIIKNIDNRINSYKEILLNMSNVINAGVSNYIGLCEEIEAYCKPLIKENINDVMKRYEDLCVSIEQLITNYEMKDEIASNLYNASDGKNRYPLNIPLDKEILNMILNSSIGSLKNRLINMSENFE